MLLEARKRQGNLTLAITNSSDSPLAQAADFMIDIMAGAELAVAATKTYTTEFMAIAMLSAALAKSTPMWNRLGQVSGWIDETLQQSRTIEQVVQRYRYMP